jgi:hypothetical protein
VDGHCYAGWRGCGFGVTAFQLVNQSKDLQRIEQNFRKLSDLRKALRMPLEGIWDYHVEYTKYFGKDKPHRKISEGIAVFLWTDGPPTGYNFFVGGGVARVDGSPPTNDCGCDFYTHSPRIIIFGIMNTTQTKNSILSHLNPDFPALRRQVDSGNATCSRVPAFTAASNSGDGLLSSAA